MTRDILVGTDPLTADSKYMCSVCNRCYKYKQGLVEHQRYECGKEPAFQCPFCPYKAKKRNNLKAHTIMKHAELMFLWDPILINKLPMHSFIKKAVDILIINYFIQ